jgi:hypothetical protein
MGYLYQVRTNGDREISVSFHSPGRKQIQTGGILMKRKPAIVLLAAACTLMLFCSSPAFARDESQSAAQVASKMVPAEASISKTLDITKDRVGDAITARLSDTVHLKNGPKLPSGTELIGNITNDDMNVSGKSKFALNFTSAKLKDGQIVPIKATIVGIFRPQSTSYMGVPIPAGTQVPNNWTDRTLQVDQIDVLNGVDLHSKISSQNSGVLVSSKDNDMKLHPGTELALAIAERTNN